MKVFNRTNRDRASLYLSPRTRKELSPSTHPSLLHVLMCAVYSTAHTAVRSYMQTLQINEWSRHEAYIADSDRIRGRCYCVTYREGSGQLDLIANSTSNIVQVPNSTVHSTNCSSLTVMNMCE
jgi:hypothetical protein